MESAPQHGSAAQLGRRLRIALVASEVAPFAKTGGLADVVGALGLALHRLGHDVRIFVPAYAKLREVGGPLVPGIGGLRMEFPGRSYEWGVARYPLPRGGGLSVEFIDCPALFHRAEFYTQDADEHVRWAAFSRMVIESFQHTGWAPDIVHCNDWHTGLLPLFLRARYAWDRLFAATRTVLSIHNIGYQGQFGAQAIDDVGLGEHRGLFHQEQLEKGQVNYMVTGILYATWLSTVSETYAREIQDKELGMGLESFLVTRNDHLVGIINGIDPEEWGAATDTKIPANFTADDLTGKRTCRDALLARMGLSGEPAGPVIGIVSRMTSQKGFELMPDVLPVLLHRYDVRLCILGSGEERFEKYFQWLRDSFPQKVGLYRGYHDQLAHWIEAGSDLFLMPSRYEPCGLNQMYSLAYGTVPLVRHTGGLADTVERWDPERRTGTGFVFFEHNSEALMSTLHHALDVWRDRAAWADLMAHGMARDFSWARQAGRYIDLYLRALQG
ncbi:MAG: glycogen synthase [Planctomycetota bacterium]